MSFFSLDSKFMQVMTSVGEIMLLNLCFLLGCLPLFTIGASVTAMYVMMGRRLRGEGSGTIVPFFKAWWQNLRLSTGFWLAQVVLSVLLAGWIFLAPLQPLMPMGILLLVLLNLAFSLVYPLIARYKNNWFRHLRNAVILLIARLGWVCLNSLIFLSPLLFFLLLPVDFLKLGFIWLLFGFSLLFYLSAWVMRKITQPLEQLNA